jgi:2-hydroxy-6-oxonona-2,4-dienedioate hydrolase
MEDFAEKWVAAAGLRTRYYEAGSDGHNIVLLHGGEPGESPAADTWRFNLPGLGKQFHVFAPDRAAQGYTDNFPTKGELRISNVTNHVIAFIEQLVETPCTLVGQSRGAFVATHIARRRPDLVRDLVLTNSASMAPAYPPHKHREDHGVILGGPENARRDLAWLSASHDHIDDDLVESAVTMLSLPKNAEARQTFQEIWDDYFAEYAIQKDDVLAWMRAGNLTIPNMLVWGLGDMMTHRQDGLDVFDLMRAGTTDSRMYLMANSGHSPFAEHPSEFNALLTTFVEEHS